MRRREFLKRLLGGAAGVAIAATVDVDKILWEPKPMIVVPEMPVPRLMFHPDAFRMVVGDLFTIEGICGINPVTRETLPSFQQFIVTHEVDSGVLYQPNIITSGPYQNAHGRVKSRKARPLLMGSTQRADVEWTDEKQEQFEQGFRRRVGS